MKLNKIYQGDCLEILKTFPDEFVDCIITSPPYYGLRDYGIDGQLGLEKTLDEYLNKMLLITNELKRVLKKTGTMWLNWGDSYGGAISEPNAPKLGVRAKDRIYSRPAIGLEKCLVMQNYRMAICMIDEQQWILRNILIWHKPNCMPSSVKDRFTVDFEPVFFFSKTKRYYFEPQYEAMDNSTIERTKSFVKNNEHFDKARHKNQPNSGQNPYEILERISRNGLNPLGRNKRCVWKIPSVNYYVEYCGKVYKVSPDCPIHSPYLGQEIPESSFYGERQGFRQNHTSDKPNYLGQEPSSESASNLSLLKKNQTLPANGREQTSQNTFGSKTSESFLDNAEFQSHPHIQGKEGKPFSNSHSLGQHDLGIAISHSKRMSKNTSPKVLDDSVSDKTSSHKFGREQSSPASHLDLPYLNFNVAKCKCQEIEVEHLATKQSVWRISTQPFKGSHFAVFPERLIEPMVKAGCPEFICKKCGKAREKIWEGKSNEAFNLGARDTKAGRFKEKWGDSQRPRPHYEQYRGDKEFAGDGKKFVGLTDCHCNAGWNKGIVLDPFMGSGTTAVVAKKLGRNYLGIELNPKYIEMAEKRLIQGILI